MVFIQGVDSNFGIALREALLVFYYDSRQLHVYLCRPYILKAATLEQARKQISAKYLQFHTF